MLSLDLEHIYESTPNLLVDSREYLEDFVCKQLGAPKTFTEAIWFHGTRTAVGNTFSGGLQALNQSEKLVMDMLISHAPDPVTKMYLQAWNSHAGVPDEKFQLRTQGKRHWGPYGHLVREVHHHASDLSQHDYSRLPELIEDVCNAYSESYGQDLTPHYLKVLRPCIVWFIADIEYKQTAVGTALMYAYTSVRDLPPDRGSIYGIDREGRDIPKENIIKVEFLSASSQPPP